MRNVTWNLCVYLPNKHMDRPAHLVSSLKAKEGFSCWPCSPKLSSKHSDQTAETLVRLHGISDLFVAKGVMSYSSSMRCSPNGTKNSKSHTTGKVRKKFLVISANWQIQS